MREIKIKSLHLLLEALTEREEQVRLEVEEEERKIKKKQKEHTS